MRRTRLAWIGTGLALALILMSANPRSSRGLSWFGPNRRPSYATTPVRRADLRGTVVAGGRVDSTDKTIIECELEAAIGASWGSAAILSLLPEGTRVKKGDLLCSLDSARQEEKLRLAEILVGQARADLTEAELNLEIARLAVTEYREGLMRMTLKTLNGQIALTRSELERTQDRLNWSRRMLEKGYLSRAQVATEEQIVARIEHGLKTSETSREQFENWTAPKTLRILESDVLRAQSTLDYQTSRVAQYEERLAFFKRQVDACSIRAPHDGFLVYYTYPEHPTYRIQEGTVVLKTQKLFYLPDLKRMEVSVELHESVVREVGPGMRARVEVEGIPGRLIEGRVDSIASLPSKHWFNDVRHFTAKITLDDVPEGLKPGMTASVELTTLPRPNALVVPSLALTFEDGKDVCYVAGVDGPSRREVKVGLANRDLIEVTEGLEEGESVVLDPARQFASDFRDANG